MRIFQSGSAGSPPYLRLFVIVLLLTFIYSEVCISQNVAVAQTIRIDPSAAVGGRASQYIERIDYIIFESTQKSAFGTINQLEINERYYVILDEQTNSVLIFDKRGKFQAKIDGNKLGTKDKLYRIFLNRANNSIEAFAGTTIFNFDFNGILIKKISFTVDNWPGYRIPIGDRLTAQYLYKANSDYYKQDSTTYEVIITKNGSVVEKYLPYSLKSSVMQANEILVSNHIDFYRDFEGSDTSLYYLRPFLYNVYKLTPNNFQIAYNFIFPAKNSLPPSFSSDINFNKKRREFVKNNPVIYRLANFYKNKNNLFFQLCGGLNDTRSYIFNIQSKKLVCVENIVSDSTTYFLPITDSNVGDNFWDQGFVQYDGIHFYTSYPSSTLFNQMEKTKNKHPLYPRELGAYFSNVKNKRSNPILVQIQFKQTQ